MIKFWFQFVKEWLAWHLRISRSKPFDWQYGKIWRTGRSYDKDRWILFNEDPKVYVKRIDGPAKIEITYNQPGIGTQGKGDFLVRVPKGMTFDLEKGAGKTGTVKKQIKRKTKKKSKKGRRK